MYRKIDYLRISVTDRCNLRCSYCIPKEGVYLEPQEAILTFEEIIRLTRIFASLGVRKIRLTGGEPLVRKNLINLIRSLKVIDGIEEIYLTTNGFLLGQYARDLKISGVSKINISLDTLNEDKFKSITGSRCFNAVIKGIDKALSEKFDSLKLNMVVMKGINNDELIDFVNFAFNKGLILRFIEFTKITPLWDERLFMPIEKVKAICHKEFKLQKTDFRTAGPAQYYSSKGAIVGFIKTRQSNCNICPRLRLTSIGELKLCLYQDKGLYLKQLISQTVSDKEITRVITSYLEQKKAINYKCGQTSRIYMSTVGG